MRGGDARSASFPPLAGRAGREAPATAKRVDGRDPKILTVDDADEPPVAKTTPHRITADERAVIIEAARDEANSDKAHRKLAHHLSRTAKAFVSESTVLRVLRSVAFVGRFHGRAGKPKPAKPQTTVEAPNEIWA